MPGYKYNFVDKIKKKYVCLLCQLPMREPVRITSCGHRFCDSCLQDYLSEGVFTCPDDRAPLDYATIYADPDIQAEVMALHVRCRHHQDGCRWVDSVSSLQNHLDICRHNSVPCPNQCAALLSQICLEDHMAYTCPKRKVSCEFCGEEFTGEAMENHQGNCPSEVTWCENKCGARLKRRYLSNHMNNECHKRTVPCRHCENNFVFETLQDHYYQCPRYPITCPNRCDPTKIPRSELEIHIKEECPSANIPCTFRDVGCKYMCPRFGLDKHLEDATKMHLTYMCRLALTQEKRINHLTQKLQLTSRVTDGTFLWKIDKMKGRLLDAKTLNKEVKSEPFYTSRYGYKLGVSVFMDGNGSGEGTHMSLYIRVLQGEYDNLLEWPFRLPITFQLMDQCSDPEKREHVIESFVPNPSWKHFQKPDSESESMGFGYPKFISHDTLKHGTCLKDDQVFVKITVDMNTFLAP